MSTPTPRTNRAWNAVGDDNAEAAWSLARTLERELHESRNAERLARVQLGNERERVRVLREACSHVSYIPRIQSALHKTEGAP